MPAPPRRVVVCPQEFKGSLTAQEAAAAIARAVRAAFPDAEAIESPMADGGPGTASLIRATRGGVMITRTVRGPLGDPVEARYALIDRAHDRPLAVIETAAAAGLVLVPHERRDATRASTYGAGELIRDAIERGAGELIIGAGGSGTNDGGAGIAQALGLRLLDPAGAELPPGGIHLVRLARIEPPETPLPAHLEVRLAVDVQNPLLGPEGATAVYGPQKGLRDWQAPALEAALSRWAEQLRADLGVDVASPPGAGAGGGTPVGVLAAFPGATIESGAALVAEATGLADHVAGADLVVTGEGALDAQTAYGKAVAHVAELAREAGVPCLAVAGAVTGRPAGIEDAEALLEAGASEEELRRAMAEAAARVEAATGRLLGRWLARG